MWISITTNDNPEYFHESEALQIESGNILMAKMDVSEPRDKNLLPISMRTTFHLDLQEPKRKITFAQQSGKAYPTVQNTFFLFLLSASIFYFFASFQNSV